MKEELHMVIQLMQTCLLSGSARPGRHSIVLLTSVASYLVCLIFTAGAWANNKALKLCNRL